MGLAETEIITGKDVEENQLKRSVSEDTRSYVTTICLHVPYSSLSLAHERALLRDLEFQAKR